MSTETIKILRAWAGGPLRQFSHDSASGLIPFARTVEGCAFAGKYVCEVCKTPCPGVMLINNLWQCEACQAGRAHRKGRSMTPEQRAAAGERLRLAREARQRVGCSL